MSTMTPGLRKALIAGGVAVVLTGGGAAAVWAGTQAAPSPSGSSASSTPSPDTGSGKPGDGRIHGNGPHGSWPAPGFQGQGFPGHAFPGRGLHGEATVKDKDGSFKTVVTQRGTVESVSETSITVKSEDGFTQSYAVTGDTKIVKLPDRSPGAKDKAKDGTRNNGRPAPAEIKATDLKTGDTVEVAGTKDGSTVTATHILLRVQAAG